MKSKWLIVFTVMALLALVTGCKKDNDDATTSSSDTSYSSSSSSTATTTTSSTDTTATATSANETMGTNPAAATSTSSTSATPLSDDDRKAADKFAEGDASEVAVGKLALTKATNPDVKNFAQKLVTDHTNATNDLQQIAKAKNVTVPTEMDKEHRDFEAKLDKLSGAAFDKQFVADMVKDHDKDLKDFEKAQKEVKDADLKAWIDKTLPVIKEHDKIAHDLEKKVK